MAVGRLHIFSIGQREGTFGRTLREYQLNYNDGGNTFAGIMGEEELKEFLTTKMAVPGATVNRTMEELRTTGAATIPDIEIPEGELGALGLLQEPSDS